MLFYHNSTICLQDSSRKICGMHNFIMLTYMGLYLYNVCNVCNKNMRIYIYKAIRFSVIVSVEYKSAKVRMSCLCYLHSNERCLHFVCRGITV